MSEKPFQDYWKHNDCWGCGAHNEDGLQIKSYFSEDGAVCTWTPVKHHKAGPDNYLNGGIIASIIDCHSVGAAIADAYKQEERGFDSEPVIWYVTASINIVYYSPTPIDKPVTLKAYIRKREGRKTSVDCELYSQDIKCAGAQVLAVRVAPEDWF